VDSIARDNKGLTALHLAAQGGLPNSSSITTTEDENELEAGEEETKKRDWMNEEWEHA